MIEWIKTNFIALIAIVVSFIGIIYTRSNIKTQKYIETITVQRINWIESLRIDLSDVISSLNMLSFCDTQAKAFDKFVEYDGFDDEETANSSYEFNKNLKKLKGKLDAELTRINLVKKIDLSILRLNQKDDAKLISKLEETKVYILHEDYDTCIKDGFINNLKSQIAETLKKEWERVKLEVKKGRFIK